MSSSRLHTSNGSPLREYQARIINGVDDGDDMSLYVMPHDSLGLSQKIYESPRSASGSVRDLKSLMEVTSRAGRDYSCSCVVVNGTSGYATFLNGTYQRIEDVFYHNRPVYRRDTRVPYGNTAAVAKHLYIYYKVGVVHGVLPR